VTRPAAIYVVLTLLCLTALADAVLFIVGGDDYTISRVMLGLQRQNSAIAILSGYTCGGVLAHLFCSTTKPEPSTAALLLRAGVTLSPVVALAGAIWTGAAWGTIGVPCELLIGCGFVLGMVLGRTLVPQHPKGSA
jgi:hypothetical protein